MNHGDITKNNKNNTQPKKRTREEWLEIKRKERSDYEQNKRITLWMIKEFQKQGITNKEQHIINGKFVLLDSGKIPRVTLYPAGPAKQF